MTFSKIIAISCFFFILILLSFLFVPRTYDVKILNKREGTKYWDLETGSRIAYYKLDGQSSLSKFPVVYLHGGPGGKITDAIIESLKPISSLGHDVYLYDQIGSGHSQRLENIEEYSVNRHRQDLHEILDKIDAEKVILIGHSWGAMLAIHHLSYEPQTVDRLILTGPGPIMPIKWNLSKEVAPSHLSLTPPAVTNSEGNKKANNWRSRFMEKWAFIFKTKLASDKEADSFFTHLNLELSKSTDCQIDENKIVEGGGGYYSHIMTVNDFQNVKDRRKEFKDLGTPILILRGQCDNQKWGFTKEYLDLFKNTELKIIEGAGHNLINTTKQEYIDLILEYL